jgi:hypothetical protein
MATENTTPHQEPRTSIIQTVQTPLGFFVLVVLGLFANYNHRRVAAIIHIAR